MGFFISIQLLRNLGVWISVDAGDRHMEARNYITYSEGRCLSLYLGPISFGCSIPAPIAEKEYRTKIDALIKQRKEKGND